MNKQEETKLYNEYFSLFDDGVPPGLYSIYQVDGKVSRTGSDDQLLTTVRVYTPEEVYEMGGGNDKID